VFLSLLRVSPVSPFCSQQSMFQIRLICRSVV
jgi:hypothetical protein